MKIVSLELKGYKRLALSQIDYIKITPINKLQVILGSNGSGKAQPLNSLIKVPKGWDLMKNMEIGKEVIAKDGSICKVTGIYPQGIKRVYEIKFSDGRTARVTSDHLWKVYVNNDEFLNEAKIVTTLEIITLLKNKDHDGLLYIDLIDSEQNEDIDLPGDPYSLGSKAEDDCLTKEECIDDVFLHASKNQRLNLVRGLMDINGNVSENDTLVYSTISHELAVKLVYLIRSLGGIAEIKEKDGLHYRITIDYKEPSELFTVLDKKTKVNNKTLKLRIVSVELTCLEECQCISIDHPERLYVTNDFVVTHNSSLIKETSPLPASHTDYVKEGYKIIILENNNSNYTLKSYFGTSGNIFSFIKDGEELNPGYTITVYKELVKKEFKLTQDIFDIMLGVNNFHLMSISERRSWFTMISDTDYTYAIKYYLKLRDRTRDIQGSIKVNQMRLIQEKNNIITKEEETNLRKEIEEGQKLLKQLIDNKGTIDKFSSDLRKDISDVGRSLIEIANKVTSLTEDYPDEYRVSCVEDLYEKEIRISNEIAIIDNSLKQFYSEIENKKESLRLLDQSNINSLNDLDKDIDRLALEIKEHNDQIRYKIDFENPSIDLQSLISIKPFLSDIFNNLSSNPDKEYSKENYNKLIDKRKNLEDSILKINSDLDKYRLEKQRMDHAKEHQKTECPKCNYVWSNGYNEDKYLLIVKNIEENVEVLGRRREDLETTNRSIVDQENYFQSLSQYKKITEQSINLKPLWSFILNGTYIFEKPQQIIPLVEDVLIDLDIKSKVNILSEQLNNIISLKNTVSKDQLTSIDQLKDEINSLESSLHSSLEISANKKSELTRIKKYINIYKLLLDNNSDIKSLVDKRTKLVEQFLETKKQEAINEMISILVLEISKKEKLISNIDIQKALISDLDKQVENAKKEHRILKEAVKHLSPEEGLIAKGLTGFINHFVYSVNSFIKNIWLYPLELVPIKSHEDEIDLDYKFSVLINGNISIKDVKEGSSAMKEIIDLAFKVVSMKFLGMNNYPLYLDEFSIRLDAKHRESAFYAISQLIDASDFSQIFMISHYEKSYGCLNNADFIVLRPENIVIPENVSFNRHIKLKED